MKQTASLTMFLILGVTVALGTPRLIKLWQEAEGITEPKPRPKPTALAEALAASLEGGQGWRLAKDASGLVNEDANIHLAMENWWLMRPGIYNWNVKGSAGGVFAEGHTAADLQFVIGPAQKLREKLYMNRYKTAKRTHAVSVD